MWREATQMWSCFYLILQEGLKFLGQYPMIRWVIELPHQDVKHILNMKYTLEPSILSPDLRPNETTCLLNSDWVKHAASFADVSLPYIVSFRRIKRTPVNRTIKFRVSTVHSLLISL